MTREELRARDWYVPFVKLDTDEGNGRDVVTQSGGALCRYKPRVRLWCLYTDGFWPGDTIASSSGIAIVRRVISETELEVHIPFTCQWSPFTGLKLKTLQY